MNRLAYRMKERVKFYILILLLLTSIVQLGILWNGQNQGLPFNFLYLFSSDPVSAHGPKSMEEFFTPFRIVLSEGSDNTNASRWILNKKNKQYDPLWEEVKYYLKNALGKKSDGEALLASQWYSLIDRKAFIFEFKTGISVNLLKEAMGLPEIYKDGPSGVYKLILSPWEDSTSLNSRINTLYIFDGSKIYRYYIPFNRGEYKEADSFEEIIYSLKANPNYTDYTFLKQPAGEKLMGFREDIPVGNEDQYSKYGSLASSLPLGFGGEAPYLEAVASKILGSEKGNYDRSMNNTDKTIELKTLNNLYKIYPNGFMEYDFLSTQRETANGSLEEAFKKALTFVQGLSLESENTSLFLSGYTEKNGQYEFSFDYMVSSNFSDVPVYMEYDASVDGKEPQTLHHAITVEANGGNVTRCRAMIKDFTFNSRYGEYGVGILQAVYFKNPAMLAEKNNEEKNVVAAYRMGKEAEDTDLDLVWVIEAKDRYFVSPMIRKGG